jgi:hypothetical protein
MNVYLALTREMNAGRLRAVISSGQAVVLHRVAIMSKDGDWVLREDNETMEHVLNVLSTHGARYRYGAPLDVRWLSGGWSSHFEFHEGKLRVRTDFVTRPPRVSPEGLGRLWREQEGREPPFVPLREAAEIKKTNREKDYAVIGELARLMKDPSEQLLFSRSARDLTALGEKYPQMVCEKAAERPLLAGIREGIDSLERALDEGKRMLIHAYEKRLGRYMRAAGRWAAAWPSVEREMAGHALAAAHEIMSRRAEGVLPFLPEEEDGGV